MLLKNFDKFSSVLHFSTLKLLLLVVENHCVFKRSYFETVRLFPEMCVKNAKRRPKIITGHDQLQEPRNKPGARICTFIDGSQASCANLNWHA